MTVQQQLQKDSLPQAGARRLRVALVSCGLGNVHRGFEVSTDRWFRLLKDHPGLDVRLFTGGKHEGGKLVLNIPRDWVLHSPLALFKPFNRRRYWEFCYGVEQISFGLFYWPELVSFKPDIIWTKEVPFGYFLPFYRAALGLEFKTIFANGGAFRPQTYKDFDFIQHLTLESQEEAINFGIAPQKMTTLTNPIIYKAPNQPRETIRAELGYAPGDYVVICVAAWNAYHKRLDYLIEELAALNDPSIKLLLCGHPDAETNVLRQLGKKLLGDRIRWVTLPEAEVQRALRAADLFVLPSVNECLGNSIVEAIMAELPVVIHDNVANRFVFAGDKRWSRDLTQAGALRNRLLELRADKEGARRDVSESARTVLERFTPEALVPRFYDMVRALHQGGEAVSSEAPAPGSAGNVLQSSAE